MTGTIVSAEAYFNGSLYAVIDTTTNSDGVVRLSFPVTASVEVKPSMGTRGGQHAWNAIVKSSPTSVLHQNLQNNQTIEFRIKPAVLVEVMRPRGGPAIAGATVFAGYPIWQVVGTFSQYSNQVWFYPDLVDDALGTKMALSGEVILQSPSPFAWFYPQIVGDAVNYDCTNAYVDGNGPTSPYQQLLPRSDHPAEYSWEGAGGPGWSYFPLTGDDRVPNSPNVYVAADFQMSPHVVVDKSDLRLNGATSATDLNHSNGHTAVFSYPIPSCGEIDLQVEYRMPLNGGDVAWFPLDTHHMTRASNVDYNGSGGIDVGDLGAFTACMGSCEGGQSYNPCFDIIKDPGNCIDIADAGAISNLHFMQPNKSSTVQGKEIAVLGEICNEPTNCVPLAIASSEAWDVAVIELDVTAPGVEWVPVGAFDGRSVLVESAVAPGRFGLYLYGPAEAGTVEIGQVIVAGDKAAGSGRVISAVAGTGGEQASTLDTPDRHAPAAMITVAPNPFNPSTVISLDIGAAETGRLAVYSLGGKLIRVLDAGDFDAGRHEYRWDGTDQAGRAVAAGSYLYLYSSSSGRSVSGKMTLLK